MTFEDANDAEAILGFERWIRALLDHEHYAEFSRLEVNVPYPLWDFTSSGLTETWPVTPPNARRVTDVLREANFGLLQIDWQGSRTQLEVEVRDVGGKVRLAQTLALSDLQPASPSSDFA